MTSEEDEPREGDGGLVPFRVHDVALLRSGQTHELVARLGALWAHVKVYAEGGENGLHAHVDEDHLFLVLSGEAAFRDGSGQTMVVGALEGIAIAHGELYSFRSCGTSNLVLLRVGAPRDTRLVEGDLNELLRGPDIPVGVTGRVGPDGLGAPVDAPANGTGALPGVALGDRTLGRPVYASGGVPGTAG